MSILAILTVSFIFLFQSQVEAEGQETAVAQTNADACQNKFTREEGSFEYQTCDKSKDYKICSAGSNSTCSQKCLQLRNICNFKTKLCCPGFGVGVTGTKYPMTCSPKSKKRSICYLCGAIDQYVHQTDLKCCTGLKQDKNGVCYALQSCKHKVDREDISLDNELYTVYHCRNDKADLIKREAKYCKNHTETECHVCSLPGGKCQNVKDCCPETYLYGLDIGTTLECKSKKCHICSNTDTFCVTDEDCCKVNGYNVKCVTVGNPKPVTKCVKIKSG